MGGYLPVDPASQRQMLAALGLSSAEELFADVPREMLMKQVDIPQGQSEMETEKAMRQMAGKNKVFASVFRGAGAYRHYIPAIVKNVTAKEEFVTAYTPYQAEISQGILQAIYEYQTMICRLTGMDAANASVYDGATAAAEALAMCWDKKKPLAIVAASAPPQVIQVCQTYCFGSGMELAIAPLRNGLVDKKALRQLLQDRPAACFYLQQPNYFGLIEDAAGIAEIVREHKTKLIMGVNPVAAALLQTPGEIGADIAVGEGQPLGMPLSFGGPYLGFMAANKAMMRKLPGRIVGETTDNRGNRAFVLTLQAREQHIRREKASSNICSNQALCALTASVYMAAMGPAGLRQAASLSVAAAHRLAEGLCAIPGFSLRYKSPFFHEFVTECPVTPAYLEERLAERGILSGLPLEDGGMLWCATEMNDQAQIDALLQAVREVTV
ncbi:MAG: aminomethyl-transferring glycine dehydrogenase subunit GcvPA [Firmicutes bacterium]|nr:aminomethyl-transferring glycine dehydrogenase subunit GcvPA [Bacillota bacterium]